jgi:hypothetical protein
MLCKERDSGVCNRECCTGQKWFDPSALCLGKHGSLQRTEMDSHKEYKGTEWWQVLSPPTLIFKKANPREPIPSHSTLDRQQGNNSNYYYYYFYYYYRHKTTSFTYSSRNSAMGLLTILKKNRQKEKEIRLLMLGLDNAGKTTILKRINGEDIDEIAPTLGFNIKTLEHKG